MSIYRQATLGLADNYITFNDFSNSPVYRVQTRAPQRFQIREQDIPIPFEDGISDFKTLLGKTIYVIKGTMYPSDESSYDEGIQKLRSVCSLETQQEDSYSDDGYVPYTYGEANDNKTIFVKALYVQIVEDTRQGFVQPFVIYCKIKDPTIYGSILKIATTQGVDPTVGAGSSVYPFAYPESFSLTAYSVTATATNYGTIASYPFSIYVYGPIANPKISNTATGEYIQVSTTLASSSDILMIKYGKDFLEATLNGVNVTGNITKSSTFFKIKPGSNPIELNGSSLGSGGYVTLSYRDSYALA